MKMIVGGAFQGQLAWAKEHMERLTEHAESVKWADGNRCELEQIVSCGAVYDFQEYIRRGMEQTEDREAFAKRLVENLIRQRKDLIIVTNEIGCGLVPVDAFEREWREQTGRICTELARQADLVVHVVMGIGTVIKGEL